MSRLTRAEHAPLAPGAEIAPGYEVVAHMRRGNDLDVYDAWSRERHARCVVKALRPDRLAKQRARDGLLREGRVLERLTHPHIVRAYETLEAPAPAVVLETLGGRTLGAMTAAGERANAESAAHLGLQLASAVGYLHAHGLLHLDLKPSNVIAEAGRAKVIDLSVARAPGEAPPGVGTWAYLSPEQARGGRLGPPADVWGIGVVLFEAVTGEPPFAGTEPAPLTSDDGSWSSWATNSDDGDEHYPQLEAEAPRADAVADVDPEPSRLIASCLAADPGDRPGITELMAAFEGAARIPAAERLHARG